MYKIQMDYENIIKYFKVYSSIHNVYYIAPIYDDMDEYMENITSYIHVYSTISPDNINFSINIDPALVNCEDGFMKDEKIIFSSETEEAFYFKLKFC